MLIWSAMTLADIAGVCAVADVVHPEMPESPQVIEERLQLYPQGCWVLIGDDNIVLGYAISHPIVPFEPPALNSLLGVISPDALQYYIHDVAIVPASRGHGHARLIIDALLDHAAAYESIALISVYGTATFWESFGFEMNTQTMPTTLDGYGDSAIFMTR